MVVGRIVGEFGLKGAVRVEVLTDFMERFEAGATLYLLGQPHTVETSQVYKNQVRLKLSGVDTVDRAEELKWENLYVPVGERPELEKDEFYASDLVGMSLVLESGKVAGKVDDIVTGAAQDLIRCGEYLIPMVKQFVLKVDLKMRIIIIRPIPGLLDDGAEEVR